ncbi:MAG: hypothetical protein JWN79_1539 [Gemmatimonadetes bacterium]|nr:hypothetical protein [Gemmatimonadota bacterium]
MQITYDFQIFAGQRFGGISRYVCAIAELLARVPGVSPAIVAPLHANGHLREVDPRLVVGRYVRPMRRTGRLIELVDRTLFEPLARRLRPDIVHETFFSATPTYRGRVRRVLTVHDMINEVLPSGPAGTDPIPRRKRLAVARADHVICCSENTRNDVLSLLDVSPDRVSVVYHGHEVLDARGLLAAQIVGEGPYLLFVGARGGYKNFLGFATAHAGSRFRKDVRIVCFGGGPMSATERAALSGMGFGEHDVVHRSGGDDLLAALYTGAAALVYPSRYEGFGIPIVEAMSLGCPVACSDTSSMPEVAGNAGAYFDPDDTASIREALESLLDSSERRAGLIARGWARSAMYTWNRCATETLAAYRALG